MSAVARMPIDAAIGPEPAPGHATARPCDTLGREGSGPGGALALGLGRPHPLAMAERPDPSARRRRPQPPENGGAEGEALRGHLLIAMPGMSDPRFERAVVFLCEHSDKGTMGIVINKPSPEVSFPDLARHLDVAVPEGGSRIPVHVGGPVEPGRGFVLHTADYERDGATLRVGPRFGMTATVEILREIAGGAGPSRSLLALGYAGWAPGQLDAEIAGNGWLTAEASTRLVFDSSDREKWSAALASLGIDPISLSSVAGRA